MVFGLFPYMLGIYKNDKQTNNFNTINIVDTWAKNITYKKIKQFYALISQYENAILQGFDISQFQDNFRIQIGEKYRSIRMSIGVFNGCS